MAENVISGDTFIKDGNTNSESLTVNSDKSTSGIANSIVTVKKDSDADSSDVAVFIDVSKINTADQNLAEVYALVSRVVNDVNFNGKGLIGANLVGRDTGDGDFEYIYGELTSAEKSGSGNVDFLVSSSLVSKVTGTDSGTIDIMRSLGSDVVIDNPNKTVNNAQGMHPSVQMINGTIGNIDCLYLDLDYDNTGTLTVTGDIAYLRIGNDALPSVGGNIYAIKSESTLPSEFAGSITASDFLGNFNGQPASYYNFRNFGLGTGVEDNAAFTGDVLTIAETGFKRVASSATNIPVTENGFLSSIYRSGSFKTYSFISDSGNIYRYAGGAWHEMAKKSDLGLPSGFYEEGTFTPTLTDEGAGATYTATVDFAKYVRNGNSVTIQIKFNPISTTGTPTGNLRVSGLPFDGINLSFFEAESSGGDVGFISIKGQIGGGGSPVDYINLRYKSSSSTGLSSVYNSVTFTSGALFITGTYITNDYTP